MAKVIKISGYEEFKQKIDEIAKSSEHVNVLFSGKKDAAGRSWCSDCNDGTCSLHFHTICWIWVECQMKMVRLLFILSWTNCPVVLHWKSWAEQYFCYCWCWRSPDVSMTILIVFCSHRIQSTLLSLRWKDMKNAFRLDKSTHLSVIPTLINWKQKEKRLEGEQLCKPELLEMYFEDE